MSSLSRVLNLNQVWSIGVYVETVDFGFQRQQTGLRLVLNARTLRTGKVHIHTYADPFLFVSEKKLYMFYERQDVGGNGYICALSFNEYFDVTDVGEILRQPFHISYPCVFGDGVSTYLVPESSANNEIALYRFVDFPLNPTKIRTLLQGFYVDSSFVKHNGLWYMFTTSQNGLEIFYMEDLENSPLTAHPLNPISSDPRYLRCGGGFFSLNGDLFRVAQNGILGYGRNINIQKLSVLSPDNYEEHAFVDDFLKPTETWNKKGGHHLSLVDFGGCRIIAVDGRQNDFLINKFFALVDRLW